MFLLLLKMPHSDNALQLPKMPQTASKYIQMSLNYLNCLRIPSNVYTFVLFLNLVISPLVLR